MQVSKHQELITRELDMEGMKRLGGGRYEALEVENNPKVCARNRDARIRALTDLYHSRAGVEYDRENPYKYWHIEAEYYRPRCICGHDLTSTSYIVNLTLASEATTICTVPLGSCCIKNVNADLDLDTEAGLGTHCPDCLKKKRTFWRYCGREVCVRCAHGLREYVTSKTDPKKKPWRAWFCPYGICDPIWIDATKPYRKPAVLKEDSAEN